MYGFTITDLFAKTEVMSIPTFLNTGSTVNANSLSTIGVNISSNDPDMNWFERKVSEIIDDVKLSISEWWDEKWSEFADNVKVYSLELGTIAYVLYLSYFGLKMFFNAEDKDYSKIYISTALYITFRLVWKVVFGL